MSARTLRVRQVRSVIGFSQAQRATLRGLGLRKIGSIAEVQETAEVKGMLRKVAHLVQVEEAR